MNMAQHDTREIIRQTMQAEQIAGPAIESFLDAVERVQQGETGMIPESEITPARDIPRFDDLPEPTANDASLLRQLAVIKLNGGLGTSMGLAGPKSLLQVRGNDTFLDFIARQILRLRQIAGGTHPVFLLMNSFSTREQSLGSLQKYPTLANADGSLDFVQNKVPKLDAETLLPLEWPADPALQWCPPGHGDLYPSLLGNGDLLQRLLDDGVNYLFVSNADNLGATVDMRLLRHFAKEGLSFLMEVAGRTESDRKGGHLARRLSNERLLLRESAQCPEGDLHEFHDIDKHQYFNTNNLWIRLDAIRNALQSGGGKISLPLIRNRKTIDPQDPDSPAVLQLESAMGAAIECFDDAGAVAVPRSRFAPVKTTSDLLAVRSDAYVAAEHESVLRLASVRQSVPPRLELDPQHYKLVGDFDRLFPHGPPSLIDCSTLHVHGPVLFEPGTLIEGEVSIENRSDTVRPLPAGTYADTVIRL
jgi:UTP--glucose-1-phosphate uridylyltransferase